MEHAFAQAQLQKLDKLRQALPQEASESAIARHLEYVDELECLDKRVESFSSFGLLKQEPVGVVVLLLTAWPAPRARGLTR